MASWNVRGRSSNGMLVVKERTLDKVVLMKCLIPQQWESVAYNGMSDEMAKLCVVTRMTEESGRGDMSRSRVGSTLSGLCPQAL
jgi:hypothetical protein